MRVVVAGGTGVVGRHVVAALEARGDEPVVLARSRGTDLADPEHAGAVAEAVAGAGGVVDVTSVATVRRSTAVRFFAAVTGRLLAAAREAGVGHVVVLSIVGVDRVPFGYYEGKVRQEELVRASGLPATVLRATQFHEFAGQMLDRSPGPVAVVPEQLNQPVAAREVGAALAELAAGAPSGLVEMAGPARERLDDMARRVERARGGRRRVVGVRLPGAAGRAMAGGGLLPTGDHRRGTLTFADWLASEDAPQPRPR